MKKIRSRSLVLGALAIALVSPLGARQSLSQSSNADHGTAAPSTGGAARTADKLGGEAGQKQKIEECMGMWDAGTHMNKQEWRATCERSLSQSPTVLIPELPPDTAVR